MGVGSVQSKPEISVARSVVVLLHVGGTALLLPVSGAISEVLHFDLDLHHFESDS